MFRDTAKGATSCTTPAPTPPTPPPTPQPTPVPAPPTPAPTLAPDNTEPAGAIVGTLLGVFAAIVGIVVGCRGQSRKHKARQYAAQVVPQKAPPQQQVAAQQAQQQQMASPAASTASTAAATSGAQDNSKKLFLSYARGDESTPFARRLKAYLEEHGFDVWMDEEGIAGGANFMSAIGSAIMDASGMVAVIDQKFCGSTYCNNELAMGQGQGLHLFPILFRSLRFDAMPHGLQYMLATTNVVPFPEPASDEAGLQKLTAQMRTTLVTDIAQPTIAALGREELAIAVAQPVVSQQQREQQQLDQRRLEQRQHEQRQAQLPDAILADAADVPDEFLCPITREVMNEPVVCADGHTYERDSIREWFRSHRTSPKTNTVLPHKQLVPNHALRSQIGDMADRHRARKQLAAAAGAAADEELSQQQLAQLEQGDLGDGAAGKEQAV